MILTIIEYGGLLSSRKPRQIECESFEFRCNQVTNWIRIKTDGCEELIHNVCVIKTQAESEVKNERKADEEVSEKANKSP